MRVSIYYIFCFRREYANIKSRNAIANIGLYCIPRRPRFKQLENCVGTSRCYYFFDLGGEATISSVEKHKYTDFGRFVDDVLENGCKLSGRRRCRFRITVKTRRSCFSTKQRESRLNRLHTRMAVHLL